MHGFLYAVTGFVNRPENLLTGLEAKSFTLKCCSV
jgi:hypothetical protein